MDNVIVVSDDNEDEAKDVVNSDSNSDLYVGHRTKSLIFSGVIYFNAHITLNTQVQARELCQSVSADAPFSAIMVWLTIEIRMNDSCKHRA